jgi:ribosomal protein S11
VIVADGDVRRWSRRIVHPRLVLTTTDTVATVRAVETALRGRGFRTTTTGAGFRARRRPWFDWLASAAASSCVLVVQPVSATTVEVDVEACGNHPAPARVAEALTRAVAELTSQGVQVRSGEWQPVP